MSRFFARLAVLLLLAVTASAADVHAVLAVPRQRIESADYRATGRLVRVEPGGNRISFPITIKARWFPGVLRVLVEIGSGSTPPANSPLRGHIPAHMLLEMRPSGQDAIQIAYKGDKAATALPFEKWSDGPLGPGFSYEDFLEPQYFWLGQKLLEVAKYGARDCNVIESIPGAADRTHYAEVRTWLDRGIGYPVYAEKTLKGTGAVKTFTYFGLRQNDGVWSATQVEEKTRGSAGSALLIIDRGSAKANLASKDFSTAQLLRF
jgi:Outer membrane lipoprotein-sorting protein